MIFPRDFVQCANRWSAVRPAEGGKPIWRSAVSRSYYGAYHHARDFLGDVLLIEFTRKGGDSHKKVREALKITGDENLAAAGRMLKTLAEKRELADYQLRSNEMEDPDHAAVAVAEAREIIAAIDLCASAEARAAAQTNLIGQFTFLERTFYPSRWSCIRKLA
jgi:hypothetical protein